MSQKGEMSLIVHIPFDTYHDSWRFLQGRGVILELQNLEREGTLRVHLSVPHFTCEEV